MIDISNRVCCGCTACASICPQNAIEMSRGDKGFLYPKVNRKKCIQCGLCDKACDFADFKPTENTPKCYAVKHKDEIEISTSRSGAVFMAMCEYITKTGGVVYGCELLEDMTIAHKKETLYAECSRFKGSKYVQSDMKSCFRDCRRDLLAGKKVLFSGTGCQVHGLIRYLQCTNTNTSNLYTVDIVCHGVPSPGVWDAFVNEMKHDYGISHVNFRDKSINGWADHIESYTTQNGEISGKQWTRVFYRHILFRDSCYVCPYTTVHRKSDFTIADYWGIGRNVPAFDDNKGTSLVLVNTEKGAVLFQQMEDIIQVIPTELQHSMQPQMKKPIWKGWDYKIFWWLYRNNPKKTIRMYFFPSKCTLLFWSLESKCKKTIKKMIKR